MLEERGKDNALASILHSITLGLSYYFQWVKSMEESEKQARYYAHLIVKDYLETRARP